MNVFDELSSAVQKRRQKDVVIEINGKSLKFVANEMSYTERLHVSQLQSQGREPFSQLIAYSIVDPDGNKMTVEQANQLPNEIAEKFFLAATEVNTVEVKTEKN